VGEASEIPRDLHGEYPDPLESAKGRIADYMAAVRHLRAAHLRTEGTGNLAPRGSQLIALPRVARRLAIGSDAVGDTPH
jgi:hypothetical protein